MLNYKNNGVSVALVRKVVGKKTEDIGECPIYWRITYLKKVKYYFTGSKFTMAEWEDITGRDLSKHRDLKRTWQRYFDNTLKKIVDELVENNEFTFDLLNKRIGKSDIKNLNEAFTERIEKMYTEERVNYAESFKYTLSSLEKFNKDKTIQFNEVTVDFLRRYEKYLLDEGKSISTVGFYMRNIRTIINGDGEPLLKAGKYPFGRGKYIIPKAEGRQLALKLEEIHMIQAYKCNHQTDIYRDLWLFSFYGNGMNMTDICRLKYSDIQDGELVFIRKKTKKKRRTIVSIYVPIIKPINDIIKKHGCKNKNGFIFPFLNGVESEKQRVRKIADVTKNVNETIQLIAKDLKLPEGITTYATRHSYVTILERLNVPRVFIKNSLGHAHESVTDSYSKLAEKELRFKYNSLLLPKSNNDIIKELVGGIELEMMLN